MSKLSLYGWLFVSIAVTVYIVACSNKKKSTPAPVPDDSTSIIMPVKDRAYNETDTPTIAGKEINTGTTTPDSVLAFAKTLIGIPYLYASTDPAKGFDCSGFITYVFNHFNITVPRSSVDFTNYGNEINIEEAKPGDLILFTGTDSTIRIVGHMGIVENTDDGKLHFIHSTSGKGKGVVITPFESYYQSRFVKVIRIF